MISIYASSFHKFLIVLTSDVEVRTNCRNCRKIIAPNPMMRINRIRRTSIPKSLKTHHDFIRNILLLRDRETGEFGSFYPSLNRNLNSPASLLRHLKAVTQEKWSLRHCLQIILCYGHSWGGRIENSNYCMAWVKTYSNFDFS